MKRRLFLLAGVILLPLSLSAATTDRYLVATRHPFHGRIAPLMRNVDAPAPQERNVIAFESVNGFSADLTPDELASLKKSPEVAYIEFDQERHALGRFTPSANADQVSPAGQTIPYGVTLVNAPAVWPVTRGASLDASIPVRIAIIDTGIAYTHPEFAKSYKGGYNFIANNADPMDDEGHGTHVAGTIAAKDDATGVIGVAPDVQIYSLKVLDQCGSGSTTNIIRAVDWVIAQKKADGADWIMSLSLGSSASSTIEETEFQKAADAGILTIAASGNDYGSPDSDPDALGFPAGYSSVVSVGAIDDTKTVASFSQRGPDLKVVAPGVDVLSTFVSESVRTAAGTVYQADQMSATKADGTNRCLTRPVVSGPFVSCGQGHVGEFPAAVNGRIALIQRGDNTFAEKATNAQAAGATAVIVYNNIDGDFAGTLGNIGTLPLTVSMSKANGEALLATPNTTVTLDFGVLGYADLSGTSMATPHASAVAALAWSVAPNATAIAVRNALFSSAKDLGVTGFDTTYGNGMVDALAAAKALAPEKFVAAVPTIPSGRRILRRGH